MYAIKVYSPYGNNPVIDRSMSSNKVSELIPTVIEICKQAFNMKNPTALHMGNNVYRIFDVENPKGYAKVTIAKG